jgi:hypothetical protein
LSDFKPHRNYTFTVVVRSGTESQVLRQSLPVSAIFTTMESGPGKVRRSHDWTEKKVQHYEQIQRFCTVYLWSWISVHSYITIENWTHVHVTFVTGSNARNKILKYWDKSYWTLYISLIELQLKSTGLPFKYLFSKKLILLLGWEVPLARYSNKPRFIWMGIAKYWAEWSYTQVHHCLWTWGKTCPSYGRFIDHYINEIIISSS